MRDARSCGGLNPAWRAVAISLLLALASVVPAQAIIPNDPGRSGQPGGWQADQWNFLPRTGVDAPRAWDNLIAAGRPGARGVTIAVLDTGLAYEDRGPFRRSPDVSHMRLARGYDFCVKTRFVRDLFGNRRARCVGRDSHPDDEYGHGTHVAGTIAEATNNAIGETGLAYGATLMPVKISQRRNPDDRSMAAGIRYAVKHGARIINISAGAENVALADSSKLRMARAVRYARRHGVLIVAGAGNSGRRLRSYPAALPGVIAVGATTEHGCLAEYSNRGAWIDLVAPGGGVDATLLGDPACRPNEPAGETILQMTLRATLPSSCGRPSLTPIPDTKFVMLDNQCGTSMAAPHVSAAAALVLASGVLGRTPSPTALERRLRATARDLGPPGEDLLYGSGLLDAGAATAALPAGKPPR